MVGVSGWSVPGDDEEGWDGVVDARSFSRVSKILLLSLFLASLIILGEGERGSFSFFSFSFSFSSSEEKSETTTEVTLKLSLIFLPRTKRSP